MLLKAGVAIAADYEQAEVYSELRQHILSLTAEQLDTDSPVLVVLMETGYPEAVATLAADENASPEQGAPANR